jgi:transposase
MTKQQRYTLAFRAEAIKLVCKQGLPLETAVKRLSIPKVTLGNWMDSAKASKHLSAPGTRSAADLEVENSRLRKELAETRMERDILKKATTYFARESLPVTRS